MFYNLDVLARRKSDLGVVWLAGTLGNRNAFRKLTKKEIAHVSIEKVCETVIAPSEPMALRLSSQLMYGAVRIYVAQNELWIHDVSNTHAAMRKALADVYGTEGPRRTDVIDMAPSKIRPGQITLQPDEERFPPQYFGLFDRDISFWSEEPTAEGAVVQDFDPDRLSRAGSLPSSTPRHTVRLDTITLPQARMFADEEAGIGLAEEYGYGEDVGDQQELDLGLDDLPPMDDVPMSGGTRQYRMSDVPSFGRGRLPSVRPGVSSSDVVGGLDLYNDMPPLEDMPDEFLQDRRLEEGELPIDLDRPPAPTFTQAQAREDEASLNTEEQEVVAMLTERQPALAGAKRKRAGGKKSVKFAVEDPRISLTDEGMRNDRDTYMDRMQQLNATKQAKLDEKQAQQEAQQYLKMIPGYMSAEDPLGEAWDATATAVQQRLDAEHKAWKQALAAGVSIDEGIDLGSEQRERERREQTEAPGQYEYGADDLPPMDDMPAFEDMPDLGPTEPEPFDFAAGPSSGDIPSELARGGDASVPSQEQASQPPELPWNIVGEDPLGFDEPEERSEGGRYRSMSISADPLRRSFAREGSISRMSIMAGDDTRSVTGIEPEPWREATAMDIGLPPTAVRKEQDRFLSYCQRTAALKPIDEALTFEDVVPLEPGVNKVRIAAQAFSHVLALASSGRIRVRQEEAYGTIVLDVPQPAFAQEATEAEGSTAGEL